MLKSNGRFYNAKSGASSLFPCISPLHVYFSCNSYTNISCLTFQNRTMKIKKESILSGSLLIKQRKAQCKSNTCSGFMQLKGLTKKKAWSKTQKELPNNNAFIEEVRFFQPREIFFFRKQNWITAALGNNKEEHN